LSSSDQGSTGLKIVGSCFHVGKKIGAGSFGEIYAGKNTSSKEEIAIKLESVKSAAPQLLHEAKIYKKLAGGLGIPSLHWFGCEGGYNVMVIDVLGPCLENQFDRCQRKFCVKTVLALADQMICRLELLHKHRLIHRDVKPDNFLIGRAEQSNVVYLIDFGLASQYVDPKTNRHIPYRDHRKLTGTVRYSSLNTHYGIEQSRRDDLEALGHVLVYFLRGSLPWQGLNATSKEEKYDMIRDLKQNTTPDTLCRAFPKEFATYLKYCRSLGFSDRPDYGYLRNLFKDLYSRSEFTNDLVFE
jgi:serine/threonine protein kinase